MDKLKKRQIIILSIAALFAVYAGYELLIASPASKKVKTNENNQEISTVVSDLRNDLMKNVEGGMDEYIITRAEANWKRNPFWDRSSSSYKEWAATQGAAGSSGSAAKIIYSGYVDAGKMKIAIIDGLEYRVGEQLEMEGYVLKRVTPSKVLIVNKNTGSEVEIPISE
jgi:hypothetical protein